MRKIRVGILGATGMVGQRFIQLLSGHPWFEITCVAASPSSAGKRYKDAVENRWQMQTEIPGKAKNLIVFAVEEDRQKIAEKVDLVFCALDLEKAYILRIEEAYASLGVVVVSNNSANRWAKDIPMIIPEINSDHLNLISLQQKNRGWKKGFIVVKPNCSIQSYAIILTALRKFVPKKVNVTSLQAISGAGKTFKTWPEMTDNLIPFIGGEEEKSEKEPLKIWGKLGDSGVINSTDPVISATCIRVPAADGHMASVSVSFEKNPTEKEIFNAITQFNKNQSLGLPSSPKEVIHYFEEENRPQTRLDRDLEEGMGISMGRLRKGALFEWSFIALSHNTIRGAAGGAILTAELLVKKGYI